MTHFAELNENNEVLRVLVVPDEQEVRGEEFLRDDLGLGGRWIQTSYNGNIRRRFASPGMLYEPTLDVFIDPQPYPSWSLDEFGDWQAPVAYPDNGGDYEWNESAQAWEAI